MVNVARKAGVSQSAVSFVLSGSQHAKARFLMPGLTTVDYRLPLILNVALDMMCEMIETGGKGAGGSVTVRPELIVRGSG